MGVANEFVAYLLELLEPFGDVRAKAMFGGYGIYRHDLMFALVANDTLYLKVDDETQPEFEALGLAPFIYTKRGKEFRMSYHLAPESALEDSTELCAWARKANEAAVRANQAKRPKRTRRRTSR